MAHIPVNHPLRPMYRVAGFVAGAYLVVFGVLGLIATASDGLTGEPADRVLGQSINLLGSIVALIAGGLVLLGTAVGRNVDVQVDKLVGWGLLVVGSYSLATIRTDANFFGYSVSTVVVTYLVGLLLITISLYSKVAAPEKAGAPRQVREGRTA
ncbi:hypothetical protein GCM10010168_02670 [Actinoplanes ianthinogenes]|uniref:DUF4383 domain-containing protein n=1 Tax=Actinoplanes ianthinogenes TaxID=122358 RepID=A0ABN6CC16_9ACTN|nr:DUF4383 domain-containing protein [Actinoplanes ianthinogenes]BCJ42992.1 hypothetical protein Aiant_36490 [Actinoplanes ianthinogenes]GGQ90936.1 hypothetical protein GCM10010168_02670 [Actinoplanes ianthinogenes]